MAIRYKVLVTTASGKVQHVTRASDEQDAVKKVQRAYSGNCRIEAVGPAAKHKPPMAGGV